jgi:MarR family transcriptional regulator, lower aerobic nicotinate degradation pathway regulator
MSTLRASTADVDLVDRTAFLVHKLGQLVYQAVEIKLVTHSLHARTYFLLAGIGYQSPISQQDLSRMLGIDPTTIVALVDELERVGFVERRRNQADRRRYDLHTTELGAQTLAAAHEAMAQAEAEFFEPLDEKELGQYRALSQKLILKNWPWAAGNQHEPVPCAPEA